MVKTENARTTIALAAVAVLAGCVSSGTKVSADDMAHLKTGVTTEKEVIAKFGPPNQSTTQGDGSRTDMYMHISSSVHAANFIPVVGLFAGGASSHTDTVTFTFDPQGLLKSISSSSGQQDINTGLLNQK